MGGNATEVPVYNVTEGVLNETSMTFRSDPNTPDDPYELAIVTGAWLTGFTAGAMFAGAELSADGLLALNRLARASETEANELRAERSRREVRVWGLDKVKREAGLKKELAGFGPHDFLVWGTALLDAWGVDNVPPEVVEYLQDIAR